MKKLIGFLTLLAALTACTLPDADAVLSGATHAKGVLYIDGFFTDSRGEVEICKAPEDDSDYCHEGA